MKIEYRKIEELKPAEYNPRTISDKEFQDLQNSFKNLGQLEPAVINSNPERKDVIISGHQRIKVAESLGIDEYPCIHVNFDLAKEKEANIRMNKNTGKFDFEILAAEFDPDLLRDWGFDDLEFDFGETDPIDIIDAGEINEAVTFLIKCENLAQMEQLQQALGVTGRRISFDSMMKKLK